MFTQELEFAPIGAEWYFTSKPHFNPQGYVEYKIMRVQKDTVIQGIACKHITGARSNTFVYMNEQKQIFIYDRESEEFQILYDLSLNASDCYFSEAVEPNSQEDSICIVKVDTLQVNNIELRTQHLAYNGLITMEGPTYDVVGNYLHFFPAGDFQETIGLRCYKDPVHGILNFSNAPCDTTYYITSVNELEAKSPIKVQNNAVQILSPIDELFILDTQGKTLKRETNLNTGDVVKIPNKTSKISIIKWEVDGQVFHMKTPN